MTAAGHAAAAAGAPRSPIAWLLSVGVAFFVLNSLLTFENRWPGFGVSWSPRLSLELCLGSAILIVWLAWRPALRSRAVNALTLGFVCLVAVRYADVTAPAVLGRPVNIYWDGRHGLELWRMAAASLPPLQQVVVVCSGLAGLAALVFVVRAAIATLARGMGWARPRRVLLSVVAALTLSFAVYEPAGRDTRWFFSLPLMPTLQQQARLLLRALVPSHGEAVLGPGPAFGDSSYGVQGLHTAQGQADVVLMFAESYGAITFDSPAMAAALAEPRAALAQAIAASGRGVATARVRSPTFGGGSWLAHASMLSGLAMNDPGNYELLLASQRPTLVSHFARHGYRTVAWLPGIKRAWPEGTFYGYDRLADDAGIGYAGAGFGYWRIPDQAAMALLHAQELNRDNPSESRAPRFAVFATVNTHAPFLPLPPLVDDWTRLEGAHAYTAAQTATARATPLAVQQPLPNYVEALRYQFSWLSSYLQHRAPRPLVLVVVGDHQPPALAAGPTTSWDVPVHVISDDPALLLRLQAHGFVSGLAPPVAALGPMHDLTAVLLRVFSIPGDAPQATPALANHRASPGGQLQ